MKAQFVYENLDFERGKDPKKSMDIGTAHIHRKIVDETVWEANFTPELYDIETVIPDYMGHPILILKLKDPLSHKSHAHQGVSNVPGSFVMHQSSMEEAIESVKKRIISYIDRKTVKESLDFERGKDPKRSLDIGMDRAKNKIISALEKYAHENIPMHYLPTEEEYIKFAEETLERIPEDFNLYYIIDDIGDWYYEWKGDD